MVTRIVNIVEYDPSWLEDYQAEADRILEKLPNQICTIHHIGSTSIPKMAAKPVIDILIEAFNIDNIDVIEQKFLELGYEPFNRNIIPYVSFFTYRTGKKVSFHCHLYERDDPQILRHLRFRDYLSTHADEAAHYALLKHNLARHYTRDINQYILGKDNFVRNIDAKAKYWPEKLVPRCEAPVDLKIKHWTSTKIAHAIEANMIVKLTHFAQFVPNIDLFRTPEYVAVNSHLADKRLNYVIDTHLVNIDITLMINRIIGHFKSQRLPFTWFVSPNDDPKDLGQKLTELGLKARGKFSFAQVGLAEIESKTVHMQKISNKDDWQKFIDFQAGDNNAVRDYLNWVAITYTHDDPFEFYLCYEGDHVISTGFIVYYAGIAGIYELKTLGHDVAELRNSLLIQAKHKGFEVAFFRTKDESKAVFSYELFDNMD